MATAGVDVPLLAASVALPSPGQSLAAFVAALDGQVVDSCGGFPAGQCTALACAWCRNLGLTTPCGSCGTPDHCDGACWQGGGYAGWDWILNTPAAVPSPGDLVCYHANCAADGIGASGHVDIFYSGDATSFTSFAELGRGICKLVSHGYECAVGWHHPTASPTPHPSPVPVPIPVPVPPPPTPLGMLDSPLGAGLVLLGAGGLFWYLRGRRAQGPRRAVAVPARRGLGFHRDKPQRLCAVCKGSGLVGTGQSLGYGYRSLPLAHGPKRMCPACKGSGVTSPVDTSGQARRADLEATAIRQFGKAVDLSDASFVLPDGTMLAWPGGGGGVRTREASSHHPDLAQRLTGAPNLQPLLDRGWLRVQNFRDLLVISTGQPITPAQAARLRDGAAGFDKLVMEGEYGGYDRAHCEAIPPLPGTINACVRSLNAGITAGRAQREALLAGSVATTPSCCPDERRLLPGGDGPVCL